jgi:hypothetical protein
LPLEGRALDGGRLHPLPGQKSPRNYSFWVLSCPLWSATLLRDTNVTLRPAVCTLGRRSNVFDETYDDTVHALIQAGQPVVHLHLRGIYDLSGEFFRWEMATALAGWRIGINPLDQPNVEAAKALALQMVAAYQKNSALPVLASTLQADEIIVYADAPAQSLEETLNIFLAQSRPGDYLTLQAYVQPTGQTSAALQQLRTHLRDKLRFATTVGYGSGSLHSTDQLHKGDTGNRLFIQCTGDAPWDAPIPDEAGSPTSSITFGVLKMAQTLSDRQALLDARPSGAPSRFTWART